MPDDTAVRNRLIRAASAGGFVHYAELAQLLGIDTSSPHFGALVGKVLGRISEDEVANGRPMLSAIVVSKDTMLPGYGFFNLGQQLRLTEDGDDEMSFAVREIRRVHEHWNGRTDPDPSGGYLLKSFSNAGAGGPEEDGTLAYDGHQWIVTGKAAWLLDGYHAVLPHGSEPVPVTPDDGEDFLFAVCFSLNATYVGVELYRRDGTPLSRDEVIREWERRGERIAMRQARNK